MRIAMRRFLYLSLSFAMLAGCANEENRRIRLASGQETGSIRDKIATIQVAAAQKQSVAVLHFTNDTQDNDLEWLEQGIVEMLVTDLGQSRQLNVIPSDRVSEAFRELGLSKNDARDPEKASIIAKHLGSELAICGRYSLERDSLHIELQLLDSNDGTALADMQVRGQSLGNVFTMVDQLTRNLKGELQVSIREQRQNEEKQSIFTESIEAYKYYAQGVEAVNKFYHEQAINHFEKAIELDSTFSLAYLRLSHALIIHQDFAKSRKILKQGLQFIDEAPPKERYNLLAMDAITRGDLLTGIRYLKKIIALFPEDDEAHYNLGVYYRALGSTGLAIKHLETAVALNPDAKMAFNNLAYGYAEQGKLEYAKKALKAYIDLAPDEPNPYDSMGEILFRDGKLDEALSAYQKALEMNPEFLPTMRHLYETYRDMGLWDKAEELAKTVDKMQEQNQANLQRSLWLNYLGSSGQIDKAQKMAREQYQNNPSEIGNIVVAYLLADKRERKNMLQDWIKQSKEKKYINSRTLPNYFTIIYLCIDSRTGLDYAESLLQQTLEMGDNKLLSLHAIGYKSLLELNRPVPDLKVLDSLDVRSKLFDHQDLPKITFHEYWALYFRGIENLTRHYEPDLIRQRIKTSLKMTNNPTLQLGFTIALAQLDALRSDRQAMRQQLSKVGIPTEEDWMTSQPYDLTGPVFEPFMPEKISGSELLTYMGEDGWHHCSDGRVDGMIELPKLVGKVYNKAIYMFLPFESLKASNAQIRIGAEHPFQLWFNDQFVATKNMNDQGTFDEHLFSVRVRPGTNWILVKHIYRFGEPIFALRLTDENGEGLSGVQFGSFFDELTE
jgi:tetratricopeptide (TPR) repeat protein